MAGELRSNCCTVLLGPMVKSVAPGPYTARLFTCSRVGIESKVTCFVLTSHESVSLMHGKLHVSEYILLGSEWPRLGSGRMMGAGMWYYARVRVLDNPSVLRPAHPVGADGRIVAPLEQSNNLCRVVSVVRLGDTPYPKIAVVSLHGKHV
jgi:hypothetical protein